MGNGNANLSLKVVGEIKGNFSIPSYQRGYRWGTDEVTRLLDDIDNFDDHEGNYCLQPVVVQEKENGRFELIDGQQRLTTLYLVYYYAHEIANAFYSEPKYELKYDIRKETEAFLKNIDCEQKEKNIDFWFISNAYMTIKKWFETHNLNVSLPEIIRKLESSVKVIWYCVSSDEDPIALFTRLNIGKIELTNAELVKAMFLSNNSNKEVNLEKQDEIALQWDNIECELHDESFWGFLTNDSNAYATRLDMILNLITKRPKGERDKNYTFYKIKEMKDKGKKLEDIWSEIVHTFLILKEWYENQVLYHKIGYLIATNYKTMQDIYDESKKYNKSKFINLLDEYIKQSISPGDKTYGDLRYTSDYDLITRILLLFNVISMTKSCDHQRFAFDLYKQKNWSLEHIHAQNSENLTTKEQWLEWLKLHIPSVKALYDEYDSSGDKSLLNEVSTIYDEMNELMDEKKINSEKFNTLSGKVIQLLSPKDGSEQYKHTLDNMALLGGTDNSALNNSTFDVKRKKIIELEQNGSFIPYCTKLVFFKYYTPTDKDQRHFWGKADREAYIKQMNNVLKPYLSSPIDLGGNKNVQ